MENFHFPLSSLSPSPPSSWKSYMCFFHPRECVGGREKSNRSIMQHGERRSYTLKLALLSINPSTSSLPKWNQTKGNEIYNFWNTQSKPLTPLPLPFQTRKIVAGTTKYILKSLTEKYFILLELQPSSSFHLFPILP